MNTEGNWNGPGSPEGERGKIEDEARGAAEKARSQVHSLAETGREELAEQIGGLGRALHAAGRTLKDEEQGQAGYYSEVLGEQAERIANYLREHDSRVLIEKVEGFARSQPLLFLGGCVAAGVVIGRFFKASPSDEERMPAGIASQGPPERPAYEPPATMPVGVSSREPVVTTTTVPVRGEGEYGEPLATPVVGPDRSREEG